MTSTIALRIIRDAKDDQPFALVTRGHECMHLTIEDLEALDQLVKSARTEHMKRSSGALVDVFEDFPKAQWKEQAPLTQRVPNCRAAGKAIREGLRDMTPAQIAWADAAAKNPKRGTRF